MIIVVFGYRFNLLDFYLVRVTKTKFKFNILKQNNENKLNKKHIAEMTAYTRI